MMKFDALKGCKLALIGDPLIIGDIVPSDKPELGEWNIKRKNCVTGLDELLRWIPPMLNPNDYNLTCLKIIELSRKGVAVSYGELEE